jgi:tetraacyldisaccharide 4'-kinase
VDAVVVNGVAGHDSVSVLPVQRRHSLQLVPGVFKSLQNQAETSLDAIRREPRLVAIAGIGHPQRFFDTLTQLGIHCENRAFPDHHAYTPTDVASLGNAAILTTEKDAVKLQGLPGVRGWYLPVDAEVRSELAEASSLVDDIIAALQRFERTRQHRY